MKWQNKEIGEEIKRLSQHLIALLDIYNKECEMRDQIFENTQTQSKLEGTILKYVETEYKKLTDQYSQASNTRLIVELKLRNSDLDRENEALMARKKQLECNLKHERKVKSSECNEEALVLEITKIKSKLAETEVKLNKIYSSPVKKDVIKYNALVEECSMLNIDTKSKPGELKLANEYAQKSEIKKAYSSKIINIEGKIKLICTECANKTKKLKQAIGSYSIELNEIDKYSDNIEKPTTSITIF